MANSVGQIRIAGKILLVNGFFRKFVGKVLQSRGATRLRPVNKLVTQGVR
jgi:hypothetical protein